jgi:beta-lactamase class A
MMSAKSIDKKTIAIKRSFLTVLLLAAFAFGAFIGRGTGMLGGMYENTGEERTVETGGSFRFLRSFPGHGNPGSARTFQDLKPFRYKVDAFIQSKIRSGEASTISVFFRDLVGGHRFGIREQETISPESLLKLPLMIAYFKWAESDPRVLRRRITYTGSDDKSERPGENTTRPLERGRSYSIDDLILRMIAYNDNDAHALLIANLPPAYLDRVYKDIYSNYDPSKKDDVVTLTAYASFFRVLYNASYLNKKMSEKALRYLSRSAFRDGVVAGIPSNVDCAVKFGERTIPAGTGGESGERITVQLHEFGIIYYPNRPYLMGVMARGEDPGKLTNIMREVTSLIYEEVDRQLRLPG